jgi:hypothetical protein
MGDAGHLVLIVGLVARSAGALPIYLGRSNLATEATPCHWK